MSKFTGLAIVGGSRAIVTLFDQESGPDAQAFVPADTIESWKVDWLTEGGKIDIACNGSWAWTVTFPDDDQGAACAEALNDLMKVVSP